MIAALAGLLRRTPFFLIGALAAAFAYSAVAIDRGTLDAVYNFGIVRCLAGFFLGMLLFQFTSNMSSQRRATLARCEVVAAICVILAMSFASGLFVVLVIPLFVVVVALLQSDSGPVARLLMLKPAQFLGKVSYSIYMVHAFIVSCRLIALK